MRSEAHTISKQAVYWYFEYLLPKLRSRSAGEREEIARECVAHAAQDPLHLAETPFRLKSWVGDLTGAQITAMMLCCLWIAAGETREGAGGLLSDWPDLPMYAKLA